jgi:hypothetical protein
MKRLLLAVFVVGLVGGCASSGGVSTLDAQREVPKTDKIDKFFLVLVTDNGANGCNVNVQPKDNGTSDYVKVEKNWRVAWFVLNTCPAAKDEVAVIDFALASDVTKKKKPINWTVQNADVLIGKVKTVGNCKDMTTDAPCTTFKYSVTFKNLYFEDPEIEIIEY